MATKYDDAVPALYGRSGRCGALDGMTYFLSYRDGLGGNEFWRNWLLLPFLLAEYWSAVRQAVNGSGLHNYGCDSDGLTGLEEVLGLVDSHRQTDGPVYFYGAPN